MIMPIDDGSPRCVNSGDNFINGKDLDQLEEFSNLFNIVNDPHALIIIDNATVHNER